MMDMPVVEELLAKGSVVRAHECSAALHCLARDCVLHCVCV